VAWLQVKGKRQAVMKLFTLILLLSLACPCWAQPGDGQGRLQGNVSKNDVGGLSPDDQKLWQPKQGSAKSTSLNAAAAQENHGEVAVGVIGYTFDDSSGKILTIYPGSDLIKKGVRIGDYIVSVDGHPYNPNNPRAEPELEIPPPGTIVHLVLRRNGRLFNADVERRDSRFFTGNPSSDGYFEWAASQTRRW
jgi:hypothetical protein